MGAAAAGGPFPLWNPRRSSCQNGPVEPRQRLRRAVYSYSVLCTAQPLSDQNVLRFAAGFTTTINMTDVNMAPASAHTQRPVMALPADSPVLHHCFAPLPSLPNPHPRCRCAWPGRAALCWLRLLRTVPCHPVRCLMWAERTQTTRARTYVCACSVRTGPLHPPTSMPPCRTPLPSPPVRLRGSGITSLHTPFVRAPYVRAGASCCSTQGCWQFGFT